MLTMTVDTRLLVDKEGKIGNCYFDYQESRQDRVKKDNY